jgi:ssDNA-binding Zn-finger/Zn-ribbon topoisomerase 1
METPNIDFGGSDLLNSKDLTFEEYKDKLKFLIKPILLEVFKNEPAKQDIKEAHGRLNVACPYCGDSTHKSHAKRGNFILEGKFINTYKCFNCDEFKSFSNFFKDFKETLDLDIVNFIEKTNTEFETFNQKQYDASFLLDREIIEKYALPREEIKQKLGLVEVDDYPVWNWLKHRLQYQKDRFLYNPIQKYLVILNLVDKDNVIGLQRRLFTKGNKYLTYKLSKLYPLFRPGVEVPDEVDSISTLFGIMELNFNHPITLFEGPFDSFLYKNSVAISGASKAFPVAIPLRYWFDDDPTGKRKALEYIEREQPVFLWEKFKREYSIPFKIKWDLNDLLLHFKNNNMKVPKFDPYFSADPLDLIDI